MVITVREVDHIVGTDVNPVRISDGFIPPGVEVVTLAIEHEDRWVFALEGVDAILGVRSHRADRTEGPAGGQRAPVVDHLIGKLATADGRHINSLLFASAVSDRLFSIVV